MTAVNTINKYQIKFYIFILLFTFPLQSLTAQNKKDTRPNIILIVADDLGYADLGCYGGEIKTPNIDALARQGIRFTHFYTSPLCAPTRSMILSGNDNHVAGMGSMFSVQGTSREGKPGYEHHLTDRIITVSQLLKESGYQTFMAGKWHLGFEDNYIPYAKGFEKSFAMLNGAANHFDSNRIFFNEPTQYRENNETVYFPKGGYSSDVYTNKMIGFIENSQRDKPFFAYLTYTTPHWPLQVPADYIDRYKGKYDIGYDSLRILRFNRQKELGILPTTAKLRPRNPAVKQWANLTSEEKKLESRKMEIYAAMVENLDDHIGKLIQFLKDSNLLNNTVIVFMSDNGAAGEDFYKLQNEDGKYLRDHFNNSYENMGSPTSFVAYGPGWAQAGAAPFKLFKSYSTEGGVVTPMIISGKIVKRNPGFDSSFINVMDLAPSFLELAHSTYPIYYHEKKMAPMLGVSFIPYLSGRIGTIHEKEYVYGLEHDGRCLLIKGKWKITNISEPFDENSFSLYDLSNDIAETKDLSKLYPEKYTEMVAEWTAFKKKVGVISKSKGD